MRSTQHFDPVDVLDQEIREQRRVVVIGRNGRYRVQHDVAIAAVVDVDAANHDAVDGAGISITAVDHRDAIHGPQHVVLADGIQKLERVARHGRYVVRNFLHAGCTRGRGYDNLVK